MPQTRFFCRLAVFFSIVLALPSTRLAAVEPAEKLLPEYTKGFVSVTNTKELVDRWNETELGQLMKDPIMEPFREDMKRQFEEQWVGARDKLGLTIDDLRGVPAGELAVALLGAATGESALVLLVDVTGNQEKAEETLEKARKNLLSQGATKSAQRIGEIDVDVFDIPKQNPNDDEERQRRAAMLLHGDLLVVADEVFAVEAVLERLGGANAGCLADVSAFQAVMKRCAEDAGEEVPQIRWFVEIFGYSDAVRSRLPERELPRGKTMIDTLRDTGFEAITGLGGYVSFAVEDYEFVHRTVVNAPPPYSKAMKMLSFPNAAKIEPQTWVPREVATYTTTYVDIDNAFDNFGPLFDELFGEGETDVWPDVLDSLKNDPHGPKIDLEIELIDQLGNQVTIVTDFEEPISTTSERILIGIEVENEAAVAKALEKLLVADDTVQPRTLEDLPGLIIWEAVEPEDKPVVPSISLDAIPPLPGEDPLDSAAAQPQSTPLFPNAAITVSDGQLFVSSHLDFLVKVLQERDERETLGAAIDFQLIGQKVQELSEERCAWVFSRTDKEYRPAYELIRQGKMPESETMLGRMLNTIFGAGKKGVLRKQEIDGSKLPEFEAIRRHLGTAGAFGLSEDNGWFLKGFMLSKKAEQP